MTLLPLWALAAAVLLSALFALWLLSLRLRDASIIDLFWGAGFLTAAALGAALGAGAQPRPLLLLALVSAWAVRLTWHLFRRNWGKGEDPRYRKWREEVGDRFAWVSLYKVFGLQGLIMVLLLAPLLVAATGPAPAGLTPLDWAGAALWAVGLTFEAVGDRQLARFRSDPANRGRVLRSGLWRYTRHPNYFGDAVVWWGFGLLALSAPGAWWTLYSPILMTLLLRYVSGVTLLEQSLVKNRPGYAHYLETTSPFFPWLPRSGR